LDFFSNLTLLIEHEKNKELMNQSTLFQSTYNESTVSTSL